jgi:hypothetical protein
MIVTVTGTGLLMVGEYGPVGVKPQVAFMGRPLQASATVPAKFPIPVRLTEVDVEVAVDEGFVSTVTDEGDGAAIPKSTTSKLRPGTECVVVPSEARTLKS